MFIYLLLSVLDAFAMLTMIFKLYRLPMREYWRGILALVVGIATFSYIMRMILHLPVFDLPIQYLIFVLFMRYYIQMKFYLSAFITSAGIVAFTAIQLILFYGLTMTNVINPDILSQTGGWGVYLIQISTELICFLIGFILWKFNRGFSFIILPPHNFKRKANYSVTDKMLLFSTAISVISIFVTLWLLYTANPFAVIVMSVLSFLISHVFSKRGEMQG